jgi:hypothetical protein
MMGVRVVHAGRVVGGAVLRDMSINVGISSSSNMVYIYVYFSYSLHITKTSDVLYMFSVKLLKH